MMNESLNTLLRRVHEALEKTPALDAEGRRLVQVLASDLERQRSTEHLQSGFAELAVSFEARHPLLAGVLREVADMLGKAGV
jgi:Domain of unknown function (DUF4404)